MFQNSYRGFFSKGVTASNMYLREKKIGRSGSSRVTKSEVRETWQRMFQRQNRMLGMEKREKGVYIGHLASSSEDKQIAHEHFRAPFLHHLNPINSCLNLVHTLAES